MVAFTYRDRKHGNMKKVKFLNPVAFMQRFLLHVLPPKFVRIRYYGFLGNTVKKENLVLIRNLLSCDPEQRDEQTDEQTDEQKGVPSSWVELMILLTGENPIVCKKCKTGHMVDVTALSGSRIRYG
jgi:hypothetical protein